MGYILAASLHNWEDKLASDQENQVISGVFIFLKNHSPPQVLGKQYQKGCFDA